MRPFTVLESRIAVLPRSDIDTDQIIPARFLTVTTRSGLSKWLFNDWRGAGFPLDQPEAEGVEILVAGSNFGCGSSREHAPWALVDWGLRAIISTSFGDIFFNNSLKNGLLPVKVSQTALRELLDNPWATVSIDLVDEFVTLPSGKFESFAIDGFARECLIQGVDQLGYLLSKQEQIEAFESRRKDSRT